MYNINDMNKASLFILGYFTGFRMSVNQSSSSSCALSGSPNVGDHSGHSYPIHSHAKELLCASHSSPRSNVSQPWKLFPSNPTSAFNPSL